MLHFKCANVRESELPDENTLWKSPKCSGKSETFPDTNNIENAASLLAIIDELKKDNLKLQFEVTLLCKNCEESDYQLTKHIYNLEETSSITLNSIGKNKHPDNGKQSPHLNL